MKRREGVHAYPVQNKWAVRSPKPRLSVRKHEWAWKLSKIVQFLHKKTETYGLKINCQGLNSGFCLKTGIPVLSQSCQVVFELFSILIPQNQYFAEEIRIFPRGNNMTKKMYIFLYFHYRIVACIRRTRV